MLSHGLSARVELLSASDAVSVSVNIGQALSLELTCAISWQNPVCLNSPMR